MKLDERIERTQREIYKILVEKDKNEVSDALEKLGLKREHVEELVLAYNDAENATNIVKDFWRNKRNSDEEIDFSIDLSEYDEKQNETSEHFKNIKYIYTLLTIANKTDANEINDDLLDKLYQQGIQETQIANPSVRIAFHYYCASKEQEAKKNAEITKFTNFESKVRTWAPGVKEDMDKLKDENKALKDSKKQDNEYYQEALSQIETLKLQLKKLQNRSVFQIIGDKLFRNTNRALIEESTKLPKSLYDTTSDKLGITVNGLNKTNSDLTQVKSTNKPNYTKHEGSSR